MYNIDENGNKIIMFDRYSGVPEFQFANLDSPFKEEDIFQNELEF